MLPLEGDRKPFPFLASEFWEEGARFSPNGRWVAYQSNETGRAEVHVRSFPDGDQRLQISTQGGSRPVWAKDGQELYYVAPDGALMAVATRFGETNIPDPPEALFRTRIPMGRMAASLYQVSRDGQRFLIGSRTSDYEEARETTMFMISDWQARLGR